MEGIDVFRFEFKRKDAAKNLSTKITLSKKNDIKCDPALSFQRLLVVVVVSQSNPVDMNEIMSFELSAFPLSLFEKYTYLCKPNKPKLADAIVNYVTEHTNVDAERSVAMQVLVADFSIDLCILDGGSLLYVKWEKNKTFGEIASLYSRFVLSSYGKAIIVFNGYSNGPQKI